MFSILFFLFVFFIKHKFLILNLNDQDISVFVKQVYVHPNAILIINIYRSSRYNFLS